MKAGLRHRIALEERRQRREEKREERRLRRELQRRAALPRHPEGGPRSPAFSDDREG
ncbi:MAG: hypothetical protein JWM18_1253 [Chloroflexi bacterium]|jgi:hypothetical protein|nr:hypothetical protein [Chloroflexota bacterium]